MSGSKSTDKSSTRELTPEEIAKYYGKVDELSGGRLGSFAHDGTPATNYEPSRFVGGQYTAGQFTGARPADIKAVGGLGATQLAAIDSERSRGRQETAADPSLSIFQRQRSNQLSDVDLNARADAIRKETEANIGALSVGEAGRKTNFSADQAARKTDFSADQGKSLTDFLSEAARRKYDSKLANAQLKREDLELLANIFFGGKGQDSVSKGVSRSGGFL